MKKISVVIPMYYEEKVVEECYKRTIASLKSIDGYEYEIIFVNDGSKDNTLNLLKNIAEKDENVKVISFSRNFGHQAAVTARIKRNKWRCCNNYGCRFARSSRIISSNDKTLGRWK